jgi:hypothetical protein
MSVQTVEMKNKKTQTSITQPKTKRQNTQTDVEIVREIFTQTELNRVGNCSQTDSCTNKDVEQQTDRIELIDGTQNTSDKVDIGTETEITSVSHMDAQTEVEELETKLKALKQKYFDETSNCRQSLRQSISLPDSLNVIKVQGSTQTEFSNLPIQIPFGTILPTPSAFQPFSSLFAPLSTLVQQLGKKLNGNSAQFFHFKLTPHTLKSYF